MVARQEKLNQADLASRAALRPPGKEQLWRCGAEENKRGVRCWGGRAMVEGRAKNGACTRRLMPQDKAV